MFRLLGFLVGSVTVLTIILVVLGMPDFHFVDRDVDEQRFDAALEMLKEKQQDVALVTEEIVDPVAEHVGEIKDNAAVGAGAGAGAGAISSEHGAATEDQGHGLLNPGEKIPQEPRAANSFPSMPEDLQWYSFWNPFRSEIAARGFVTQLEKVTGLDYRVVKVKSGVYEVAFAYSDDAERRNKLTRISAATGLELPDS